jgi:hypothetical protein
MLATTDEVAIKAHRAPSRNVHCRKTQKNLPTAKRAEIAGIYGSVTGSARIFHSFRCSRIGRVG